MPHDGAVVTYLSYCKISHKRGYFDMFIVAGAISHLANIVAIILGYHRHRLTLRTRSRYKIND